MRFACDRFDVTPDVLVLGKGLPAGYSPIAAAVVSEPIATAFAAADGFAFEHGHTFGGHPPSARVAVETVADDLGVE